MSFNKYTLFIKTKYPSRLCSFTSFVPKYNPVKHADSEKLLDFLNNNRRVAVVTGAGISTESGIPDYRSEDVGLYARSNHKPVQYMEFLKSAHTRQRYWARNFVGWPRFSQFQPNIVHHSLMYLENMGKVSSVITQNVDHLHSKAGSVNVIELHGTSYRVMCLSCDHVFPRHDFQIILNELNPEMSQVTSTMIRPDGDVEITENQIVNFKVPPCNKCGGVLKPDIIFFGDNVPKQRVARVRQAVTDSDGLLVLGSSLSTFSGYRIVLQAKEEGKKVGIVNIGQTRADGQADFKISTKCGDILEVVCQSL